MPGISAVTVSSHASKYWQGPPNYRFAARNIVVPLCWSELLPAILAMPIGFLKLGDVVNVVGLVGIEQGKCLFVDPAGNWIGGYTPVVIRNYPFALNPLESGELALCVDDSEGLVSDEPNGFPFFNVANQPTEKVRSIFDNLAKYHSERLILEIACGLLDRHNLLKPWPLKFELAIGVREVSGLLQVDEDAFNKLNDDSFLELRRGGAIAVAYFQMVSSRNVFNLANLTKLHPQVFNTGSADMELDFSSFGRGR